MAGGGGGGGGGRGISALMKYISQKMNLRDLLSGDGAGVLPDDRSSGLWERGFDTRTRRVSHVRDVVADASSRSK